MPQISQLALVYQSQWFWLALTLAAIFFLVGRGIVPKVEATVDARDAKIAADLAEAERLRGEAEAKEAAWRKQMNDVHLRQIDAFLLPEREMIALDVANLQRFDSGEDLAVTHGQAVGSVVKQLEATRLRFERHGEGGIAGNADAGNMVHLERDLADFRHDFSPLGLARLM